MGISRSEHDQAVEESIVALAAAVGLDLKENPSIETMHRMVEQRRQEALGAERDLEKQEAQRRHDLELLARQREYDENERRQRRDRHRRLGGREW